MYVYNHICWLLSSSQYFHSILKFISVTSLSHIITSRLIILKYVDSVYIHSSNNGSSSFEWPTLNLKFRNREKG